MTLWAAQSDVPADQAKSQLQDASDKGDEIVSRATLALEKARALLEEQQQKTPARPASLEFQPWWGPQKTAYSLCKALQQQALV